MANNKPFGKVKSKRYLLVLISPELAKPPDWLKMPDIWVKLFPASFGKNYIYFKLITIIPYVHLIYSK